MNNIFETKEYKRSRIAYRAQTTFEYFIMLLVSDAFLAKLLSNLGVSDSLIGIITSFVSLAFIFQLFSLLLVKLKTSTKKIVMICDTTSLIFFALIYFVPFLPFSVEIKKTVVVVSIMMAYAIKYLIASMLLKWANSFVDPTLRAIYSAKNEIITLASGIVFTIVYGYIVDKYESLGNINGAFLFISGSILAISIINFICLKLIKSQRPKDEENTSSISLKQVIKVTFIKKSFRNVIIMESIQKFAVYFTVGFMGIYKTKDLLMSVFLIQLINIVASIARMTLSIPFAKYSDKRSFAKGMELGLFFAALSFLVNVFTTPERWYLVIPFTLLYNISSAGTNSNSFNMAYSYVPLDCITQAISIKNSVSGICGFIASILGGVVLDFVQKNGDSIFGIAIRGQQVLSAVSFILILIAFLFTHFVVSKQKVKIQ